MTSTRSLVMKKKAGKTYNNSMRNMKKLNLKRIQNSSAQLGSQTNRSYNKLENQPNNLSQFTAFTQMYDPNMTQSGTYYSPNTLRNKKIGNLTSRSGFWSNFNAI